MRLTNKCPARSLAILRFALPAQVVKLVDTLASGASALTGVEVQVLSWAPISKRLIRKDRPFFVLARVKITPTRERVGERTNPARSTSTAIERL